MQPFLPTGRSALWDETDISLELVCSPSEKDRHSPSDWIKYLNEKDLKNGGAALAAVYEGYQKLDEDLVRLGIPPEPDRPKRRRGVRAGRETRTA